MSSVHSVCNTCAVTLKVSSRTEEPSLYECCAGVRFGEDMESRENENTSISTLTGIMMYIDGTTVHLHLTAGQHCRTSYNLTHTNRQQKEMAS